MVINHLRGAHMAEYQALVGCLINELAKPGVGVGE